MNILGVKASWNILKGKFKQKVARMSDNPFHFSEGKQDELIGRIQKRTRQNRKTTRSVAR